MSVTVSPTSATLSASTTGTAPTATVSLSTVEGPNGRLTVIATNGSKGYANASFNGTNVVVTGEAPAALAAGTYQDSVTVKVCYDAQCTQQVTNSPFTIPVTYTVTAGNPATATPTISGLSPTSVTAGSAAFTLTVSGTNFTPTSTVMWNGQARATTYVATATLTAQITAADVATLSTDSVTVSNASSGGGVSAARSFSVAAVVPAITSLVPATAVSGGSAYTLTVNGTGFDSHAQVSWNGSPLVTTFVSATQVTAAVPAADIAASGSFPITVWNSDGSANASAPMSVTVGPAALALNSLSPPLVAAGGPAFTETLSGAGFTASSVAQWNGSARPTTFESTTQLHMTISAADIASVGSGSITVSSGGATPTVTSAKTLTIAAATSSVDATALQVNAQHNGAAHFANIVASTALPTAPAWTATLDGPANYPLVAGGRVFLVVQPTSGAATELLALNAGNGAVAWGPITFPGSGAITYDNGRLFLLNTSGSLTAYDAATGSQLWSTVVAGQLFSAAPTAYNGIVYVGESQSGGAVFAFDETSGSQLWFQRVANGDESSPTVTSTGVYVSYPCQVYAFNPTTGAPIWQNNGPCEGGGGATGAWANGVYYSPLANTGYNYDAQALDPATGATLPMTYRSAQAPAFGQTIGYFLQSGTLKALSLADGSAQWTFAGDSSLVTSPVLVNNYVFIASSSGKLYMIDATTGAQLGLVALGGAAYAYMPTEILQPGMTAGDGILVVPFASKISAFTLSNNP
ncbi:PQQ-binding-like beta-propeller repeat protein [Scleromatobacter humisilvae]|uniref:PQQ-binding-like beta-propeller repeat protein n=1 Tax=Scleromatobacter humisilvae TaxID=2897159 RepID=A0A9X2BYX4_9BURK|nr:PQQ-binding-like beta-propeller repeat protein [Scleromatobacter humisilvae]MCK9686058.1 PQQ-binding-like beta-propeller repeat protein [Scleromatobacter humisilvae]